MTIALARRMLTEPDKRLLWKFVYNFGWKGMRSVQKFKKRLRRGEYFPPFFYISVINSCNLRCQGCWVDVASPREMIALDDLNRIINDAKAHGNAYFGLLGGEPFLYPHLLEVLEAHPDAYFQILTNGHFINQQMARELRRLGNATPVISLEGDQLVSDIRRGRPDVLARSIEGVENCVRERIITGVATSVCRSNFEAQVDEAWLRKLIEMGVHYAWFHTYRVVGPDSSPELALSPEHVVALRRFMVEMRVKLPIAIVDAYWDDQGQALCPMATGVSHHIGPSGAIEPCPIIQFATETINDRSSIFETFTESRFLDDFRQTAAATTRGCIVLERPDLVQELVARHGARDTTQRQTALDELSRMKPRSSQHVLEHQVPEKHWAYRFAKKYWFFGFGAYG